MGETGARTQGHNLFCLNEAFYAESNTLALPIHPSIYEHFSLIRPTIASTLNNCGSVVYPRPFAGWGFIHAVPGNSRFDGTGEPL